ncbi:MAG: DUF1565 domain-containing protein [Bacteroidales bacterium]|nr:DUF1565 domain-containing protein [Bacteroidales bacterium]
MKKKLLLLIAIFITALSIDAQWVSPGDGTTYTMPDLVDVTEGVVTVGENGYVINADITISANDILKIDDQVVRIDVAEVLVTINGSMVCTNTNRVKFYGLNETQHFSMRFENATGCNIKKMYFSDGAGIKVIDSDVTFDDVKFVYFTRDYCNAVIDVFNCDPMIKDCYFLLNHGAAISSPANGQASPQILNCDFDTNVTDNVNTPQINLGPGGNDTIRIVGNEVYTIMAQWYVGGLSIADLMGTGETKVLLKDNIIKEGRYGYNQQGQTISSVIVGNQFIDNYHEDNPMNGGSGISIYGTTVNNKAILRNNVITGNLWGITAIYLHDIDMGTEEDWGYNEIHDNYNAGEIYDLYNNSACDITAVGNQWGTTNYDFIEAHIYHQADDPSFGLVTFYPYVGSEGIDEIPTETLLKDNLYYTLEGRCLGAKLPEDYKGVYILNGIKYIK